MSSTGHHRSLAQNSAARVVADALTLAGGIAVTVMTARWLGPAGKGLLAAITLLTGLASSSLLLGLPDAAIVRVGQGRVTAAQALSFSTAGVIPMAVIAVAVFLLAARMQFDVDGAARVAVILGAATIPVTMLSQLGASALNAQERLVESSALLVLSSVVGTALIWVLVGAAGLDVPGALLASLLTSCLVLVVTGVLLSSGDASFRPRLNRNYLQSAFRFGVPVQMSNLLVLASARVDLLLVYNLAGAAAAGPYSIALTVGTLNAVVPFSVLIAAFPRLARLEREEAWRLMTRLTRMAVLVAVVVGVCIALLAPIAIPFAFGADFSAAVAPAVVLLFGGAIVCAQYVLARAEAARGNPSLLLQSFAVSTTTMVLLDLVLIRPHGLLGAALASVAGNLAGLGRCWLWFRGRGIHWSDIRPRSVDAVAIFDEVQRLVRSLRGRPQ